LHIIRMLWREVVNAKCGNIGHIILIMTFEYY